MLALQSFGFDWDTGNREKCQKHGLSLDEIEDFFYYADVKILPDIAHSQREPRYYAIGESMSGRAMIVIFTLRDDAYIRPISARYMHQKEATKWAKNFQN